MNPIQSLVNSAKRNPYILWGGAAIIIALIFYTNTERGEKSSSGSSSSESKVYKGYKGGSISQHVANKRIGDTRKDLTFPLKITDELELIRIDAYAYGFYNQGTGTLKWRAWLRNTSNTEVAAKINLCETQNTSLKVIPEDDYYLVECNPVEVKYGPRGETKNGVFFAESQPWGKAEGSTARLCIKNVGCYEQKIID